MTKTFGPSWASLLLAAFSILGCKTTPANESQIADGVTARDYAPIKIGATWTYAMNYPGQEGEMTVKIVGEKDSYLVDDHEGAFRHTSEGLRDKQRYLIRNPIVVGTTWKTVVSASAVEHNKILSVGERCETAAGPFPDCLVIESSIRRDQNMTLYVRWTWAKGVGLAKLETEAEITGKGRIPQVKQSLVRYGTQSAKPEATASEEGPNTWGR